MKIMRANSSFWLKTECKFQSGSVILIYSKKSVVQRRSVLRMVFRTSLLWTFMVFYGIWEFWLILEGLKGS